MYYIHQINPVAIHIGPLSIHWYGLMYLLGFLAAWKLSKIRAHSTGLLTDAQIDDLIFYCVIGVILGGRVGYTFIYNLDAFLAKPYIIIMIWKGGMSFHGGLTGVLIAIGYFCHQYHFRFFSITDFVAPMVPIGLGAGRIGNFINGELFGNSTQVPWAIIFPNGGNVPRHPSQLYEATLEGLVLFIILWFYSSKPRATMATSGLFLLFYGLFRFMIELVRQPDDGLGYLYLSWITMGQILSFPMIIAGIIIIAIGFKQAKKNDLDI